MFLLTRSAVCIAMVVAALPDRPTGGPDTATFDTVTSQAQGAATAAVERFCRHDPSRCLAVVASVGDAMASTPASKPVARHPGAAVPRS